jgi:hypothetical protein
MKLIFKDYAELMSFDYDITNVITIINEYKSKEPFGSRVGLNSFAPDFNKMREQVSLFVLRANDVEYRNKTDIEVNIII